MVLIVCVCLPVAAARMKQQSCMFSMKDSITGWSSTVHREGDGRHAPMWALNRQPENLNTQNLYLDHFNLLRMGLEALLWFIVLVGPCE